MQKQLCGVASWGACSFLISLFLFTPTSFAQTPASSGDSPESSGSSNDALLASATNTAEDSGMQVLAGAVNARFTAAYLAPSLAGAAQDHSFAARVGDVLLAQATPQSQTGGAQPASPQLGDLGFPTEQTKANAEEQARLDRRSHMLKIHQRLGLITTIPLAATLLTGGLAGGHSTSSTGRDLHAALGSITAGMYFTTAYYSIFAPRIPGTTTRGPIKLHKVLAFIHGPGMVLTPILGAIAFDQKSKGERVHGIASAHAAVASITAIAYGAAILSVSVRF